MLNKNAKKQNMKLGFEMWKQRQIFLLFGIFMFGIAGTLFSQFTHELNANIIFPIIFAIIILLAIIMVPIHIHNGKMTYLKAFRKIQ